MSGTTGARTVTFVVTGEPGATVSVTIGGVEHDRATIGADGVATLVAYPSILEVVLSSAEVSYVTDDLVGPTVKIRLLNLL